jgi:CubicO group peptidase (beta-lactamase class C family)
MVYRRVDALFEEWDHRNTPGCAVAVLYRGRTVHSRGYGKADLEFRVPIRPDTVFHVASLSKQITGYLVLLLADEGMLRLDADIREYLPWVPRFGARITLEQLMHHTSGLRDYFTLMKLSGVRPMDEKSARDVEGLIRRQTTLNFRPGEDFNYCNTGWALIAAAVSEVFAGTPFSQIVKHRIFEPLGMNSSSVRDNHTTLIARRASAYDTRDGAAYWMPNFDLVGATGVHTTAEDLLRWARNIIEPRLGRPGIIRRLTRVGRLNDGRPVRYGAGLEIGRYRGLAVVKHRGFDLGYNAHLAIYPRQRFAVAIVGNASTLPTEERGRRIADIYLDGQFPAERPTPIDPPERVLEEKTGLYRHPRTRRAFWITRADEGLHWSSEPDGEGLDLVALNRRTFRAKNEVVEFVLDGTTMTIREEAGVAQQFRRVEPWTPTAQELRQFAGTYRSDELGERLKFEALGMELFARRRRWPERCVRPAYRDSFTDDIATYRFVRDRAGAVVAVVLALDRIYRLRYDRERVATARRRRR